MRRRSTPSLKRSSHAPVIVLTIPSACIAPAALPTEMRESEWEVTTMHLGPRPTIPSMSRPLTPSPRWRSTTTTADLRAFQTPTDSS